MLHVLLKTVTSLPYAMISWYIIEGEVFLRHTVDSLAGPKYDDKRIMWDGNIIGSGNGRPMPRIVLDILVAIPI